ncbi:KpsF/GutQ family sugar-phosphate isomerase [Limnoglobus roseus]|uniref:KpsF/GutQ family sugar-phosphate isomerase n=1 Tax=Limnoglobus roseus TaxID=2598579 RepID=A0A5C1A6S6_9BACT|nr:KpsF/GutQ family sugar-phosphate isomerase [Limnoglobus roseus]QEL13953.1 KpsF/GutQ family sugar-phosphate isomerase [Limnoglobus roseus]
MTAVARTIPLDSLAFARQILFAESDALRVVADRIGENFEQVIDVLANCRGRVAVVGVGKSADVGQKLVGTFNSTGTRAYTLDATKAAHGDLGMVAPEDVVVLFSHSGESEEIVRLLGPLRQFASAIIAVTGNPNGTLAKAADARIVYGPITEACPNQLAPSTSTTVMIALGDAIAFTLSEKRSFSADDFAKFHPAGSLGRKLATAEAFMRHGDELRIAATTDTVRSVFAKVRHTGRRTGAIMLVEADGKLAGLFTDSDLARLFENNDDTAFNGPIAAVMTRTPITIRPTAKVREAVDLMRSRKVSELPVVDGDGRPVGMIDITDLIGQEPPTPASGVRPALRLVKPAAE